VAEEGSRSKRAVMRGRDVGANGEESTSDDHLVLEVTLQGPPRMPPRSDDWDNEEAR